MMSNEKSELHVTNIDREDKARWIAESRAQKMTLGEWVIYNLNRASSRITIDKKRRDGGNYD